MTSEAYGSKRYVSLEHHGPPPHCCRHDIPRCHSHRRSNGCCRCLGCCCCCICCLWMFIFLLMAAIVALYFFYRPQMPAFDVENFDVRAFDIRNESKLYSDFALVVKAENPNQDIGFEYGQQNIVALVYSGSQLCWGQIPAFFHPGKNKTRVNVELKGHTDIGPNMRQEFMHQEKAGNIPLLIQVKIPVKVVIQDFLLLQEIHLREFVVYANCSMVVDHLQPGSKSKILKKDFTYKMEF